MLFRSRSNAGKSSAINAITGRRALARTAKTPGRTRLLNFFELTPGCRIVDLPGYGYAQASAAERATWAPMTTALAQRASLRGLFLIIDSRRGVLAGDDGLIAWAAAVHCPVHVHSARPTSSNAPSWPGPSPPRGARWQGAPRCRLFPPWMAAGSKTLGASCISGSRKKKAPVARDLGGGGSHRGSAARLGREAGSALLALTVSSSVLPRVSSPRGAPVSKKSIGGAERQERGLRGRLGVEGFVFQAGREAAEMQLHARSVGQVAPGGAQ